MARRTTRKPAQVSVAHEVKHALGTFSIVIEGVHIQAEDLECFNAALARFNCKPVRTTRNMMNPAAGVLVIDADTSIGCDVGSETYWSM